MLQTYRDTQRRVTKAELPPPLHWEHEVFTWFQRLSVPQGPDGLPSACRHTFLAVAQREGWDWDTAFGLLRVIETHIAKEHHAREANQ